MGGVDDATNTIWFADPDNTGHFDGTNWTGTQYAGAGWNHPYDTGDPFPVGEFFYQSSTLANGRSFSAGMYAGADMFTVQVFDATPEPATLVLIATALLALVGWRMRVKKRSTL